MSKPELQKQLQDALGLADEDFGYHESDLYVLAKPGVLEWLKANYKFFSNIQRFWSQKECSWKGAMAFDIPFGGYWPNEFSVARTARLEAERAGV